MVKCVSFLRENVSKEEFVKETCSMLDDVFKRTDNDFDILNKFTEEFSALWDRIIFYIYDSDLNVRECTESILDLCYTSHCNYSLNVLYIVRSMLDRIRVKHGLDFEKIDCVNSMCRAMESMGFIINPTEHNSGVDTYSFSKDCAISDGYLLECSFNRCFENWNDFCVKLENAFAKYQSELANTPLSLRR